MVAARFSISGTVKATKVSRATITRMRAKLKELRETEEGTIPDTWRTAQRAGKDASGQDWDPDQWLENAADQALAGIKKAVKLDALATQSEFWAKLVMKAAPSIAHDVGYSLSPRNPDEEFDEMVDEDEEFGGHLSEF